MADDTTVAVWIPGDRIIHLTEDRAVRALADIPASCLVAEDPHRAHRLANAVAQLRRRRVAQVLADEDDEPARVWMRDSEDPEAVIRWDRDDEGWRATYADGSIGRPHTFQEVLALGAVAGAVELLPAAPDDAAGEQPAPAGVCRVCGCTDDDCQQCVEATGEPCSWAKPGLCSRCAR